MSDGHENLIESPEPPQPPQIGLALPVAALVLPVVAGCAFLLFVGSFGLALPISAVVVVGSSLLMAIDAARLGQTNSKAALSLFLGMCLVGTVVLSLAFLFGINQTDLEAALSWFLGGSLALWTILYTVAFFQRKQFRGPSLAIPALLVALFFVGCLFIRGVLSSP
jgi:hypothetical protein